MREIKFRAWDTTSNQMMGSSSLTDYFKRWSGPPNGEAFYVMQFTGLKDKNGKEIYEGDIMKITEHYHEVFWDIDRAMFRTKVYSLTSSIQWDGEVIGNIYENPELLAQPK